MPETLLFLLCNSSSKPRLKQCTSFACQFVLSSIRLLHACLKRLFSVDRNGENAKVRGLTGWRNVQPKRGLPYPVAKQQSKHTMYKVAVMVRTSWRLCDLCVGVINGDEVRFHRRQSTQRRRC